VTHRPGRVRTLGYTTESGREQLLDTLRLVADGLTNRQIGDRLHISENTVKCRVRALFRDLEARDRAQAVAVGMRRGLIDGAFHRLDCASYRPQPCDCGAVEADVADEEEP
jgi:DNA-binding CsgD family transcriptional regulator